MEKALLPKKQGSMTEAGKCGKLAWRLEAGRFPSGEAPADACASARGRTANACLNAVFDGSGPWLWLFVEGHL